MVYTTNLKIITEPQGHKRKRWNKNKKKAHRKRIDISDIEKAEEDRRREERFGGPLSEQKSEDLFNLDLGDELQDTSKDLPLGTDLSQPEPTELVGFKPSKKVMPKTLKCHSLLNGLPGAKDPLKKRNRVRTKEERRGPVIAAMVKSKAERPSGVKKEELKAKNRIEAKKIKKVRPTSIRTKKFNFDLWSTKNLEDDDDEETVTESFLKDPVLYYKRHTKQEPINQPRTNKCPSALEACVLPHPGTSYNPSYDDHQKLLMKAVIEQEKIIEREAKLDRELTAKFPTAENAPNAMTWLKEMSEGLGSLGETEEEVEIKEEPNNNITISGHATTERKTSKQRRKEKLEKELTKKREEEKQQRIRESEVYRAKSINKQLAMLDKIREIKLKRRKATAYLKKYRTKKLGRLNFEEEDIALQLGDELPDSLRRLRPYGSVFDEHFKSMQRRNILEPRKMATAQHKLKKKLQVKRSHRVPYEDLRKTSV